MDVNLPERYAVVFLFAPAASLLDQRILLVSFHEMAAEHNHPRHPEEQNLVRRDQKRRRIKNFLIPRSLRPPERGERQQARGKPRVQYVSILRKLRARALRALLRRFTRNNDLPA